MKRRIRIAVPLAIAALALSVTSVAFACTSISGQTYINGLLTGTAAGGTTVTNITGDGIFGADQGWPANGSTWDVVGIRGASGCCLNYEHVLARNVVLNRSNPSDLGPVDGIAPSNRGKPTTWGICFLNNDTGAYATEKAILTVT